MGSKKQSRKLRSREEEKEIQSNIEDIYISEHAIVRYCERVLEIDVDKIRKEILTDKIIEMVKAVGGSGTFPGNGFNIVMKNYRVITVISTK